MSTSKTPVDIQLALLKVASDQLDDCEIHSHKFDSDLHELLQQAVDCIGAQIAEKNLTSLRLGAARTRGNEYLKQAICNSKEAQRSRERVAELRGELDEAEGKLAEALEKLPPKATDS